MQDRKSGKLALIADTERIQAHLNKQRTAIRTIIVYRLKLILSPFYSFKFRIHFLLSMSYVCRMSSCKRPTALELALQYPYQYPNADDYTLGVKRAMQSMTQLVLAASKKVTKENRKTIELSDVQEAMRTIGVPDADITATENRYRVLYPNDSIDIRVTENRPKLHGPHSTTYTVQYPNDSIGIITPKYTRAKRYTSKQTKQFAHTIYNSYKLRRMNRRHK